MNPHQIVSQLASFTAHWERFLKRFGKEDRGTPSVLHTLAALYGGKDRHYHGIGHIIDGLNLLEVARREVPEWFADPVVDAAVELAFWEHDSIYATIPQAYNEVRSAELAGIHATELGFGPDVRLSAKMCVRATDHKRLQGWRLTPCIVCDIDLASLAYPWERFVADTADIRREYAQVSEEDWRSGCAAFLDGMLDKTRRPVIYQTGYFYEKFEERARENLARALAELR